jgi:copper transport protein
VRQSLISVTFLLVGVLLAPFAWPHAVLLDSDPGARAELGQSPTEIRLGFNENVGPIFVKVLDAEGKEVGAPGDFRTAGNDVFLPLGKALDNGTYVTVYRVISADTHPVGGSVIFAVGEPLVEVGSVGASSTAPSAWRWPVAANRFVIYTAGALAAGSAWLLLIMPMPAGSASIARRQGRLAAWFTAVALPFAIGVGGAEMLAGDASALFTLDAWRTGWGSTLGPSALIGLPGALILLWAMSNHDKSSSVLLTLGSTLMLGSFLVTGHAATAPPAWIMALIVAIHLAALAFWLAALMPLRHAVQHEPAPEAAELLQTFSARAVWGVCLLIISGVVISAVQLRSLEALLTTDYGQRLAAKLAVVTVIVAIAVYNKHRLTPRLAAVDTSAAGALGKTIRTEFALMMVVLLLAVSMTLPSPPRSMLAGTSVAEKLSGTMIEAAEGGLNVRVEVSPARVGENMLMMSFRDVNGQAVSLRRVRVFLSLPAASLDGIEKEAEPIGDGLFHLMVNETIIPGEWEIRIDAYIDDFDKRILRMRIPIL